MSRAIHPAPASGRPSVADLLFKGWEAQVITLAALLAILLYIFLPMYCAVAVGLCIVAGTLLWANRYPMMLMGLLWILAPINYGFKTSYAVITSTLYAVASMFILIVIRIIGGDREIIERLRRGFAIPATLALLGLMAIATALPHPNFFNVRFELYNYIVLLYMFLFFKRRDWPVVIGLFFFGLAFESILALGLKFVYGLTGVSFFDAGGGARTISFSAEDLAAYAGGRFRLSGTLGHKNMLAAYVILLLPLVCIETLRRLRFAGLIVIIPACMMLAMTDSMTGWGALVLIVVLALLHLHRFDSIAATILVVFPFAVLALLRFGESVFLRAKQLFSGWEGWATVSSREQILGISLGLIEKYPLFGIGRNNFMEYAHTYFTHPHNLFLQKMIEMGIPAGVMFGAALIFALGWCWAVLIKEKERLAREHQYYRFLGLWLGCIGFLMMNFFDCNYMHFSLGPMFSAMIGILLAIVYDIDRKTSRRRQEFDTEPARGADERQH